MTRRGYAIRLIPGYMLHTLREAPWSDAAIPESVSSEGGDCSPQSEVLLCGNEIFYIMTRYPIGFLRLLREAPWSDAMAFARSDVE
jgi:hypothetical protein